MCLRTRGSARSRALLILFLLPSYARDPGCAHTYVQILICVRSAAQYPSVKIIESICMFNDDVLFIYILCAYVLGNTHRPLTKILGRKYGAKTVGGSLCSHNRKVTLPHGVDSTHITESPPHVIISLYRLLLLLSAGTYSLI